jgi:hypothetical protein
LQLKKDLEGNKQWEDKQKELEREQKRRERQVCSYPYTVCYLVLWLYTAEPAEVNMHGSL